MVSGYVRDWSLLFLVALASGASDDVIFFFTNTYGYCQYGTALMEIAGDGLCAYDKTINRVYMCDQDYAAAIGDACYALGQTCEEGVGAPGDDQILCAATGTDKTHKWCCSDAELCITGQGQYNVCGTKFLRPNTTREEEYEALGVKTVPATFTVGQVIGTQGSQIVISSTTVQTGQMSSSSALPSGASSPIAGSNAAGKSASSDHGSSLGAGAIAGIVIGAVAFIALLALTVWVLLKRRARAKKQPKAADADLAEPVQQVHVLSEVEAKEKRHEAPTDTRHELPVVDKAKEVPGTQMRHELG